MRTTAIVAVSLAAVGIPVNAQNSDEVEERIKIAAANLEDAVVVDCQLPGKLRKLGGTRTYLTPGKLIRTSAIECRTRGGEYELGDLASGTLSLQRWLVLAREGDAEAQYYVARIHANGLDDQPINYQEAARWYQLAADQGYAAAQKELGFLYEQGLGVGRDELKALNLQREATGLGEALDYAYKIADAEAVIDDLSTRLLAANGMAQRLQGEVRELQIRLGAAGERTRATEASLAAVVAELEAARSSGPSADTDTVAMLESELDDYRRRLKQEQQTVVDLQRQRDTANEQLRAQIATNQAAQRELREVVARTDARGGEVERLRAQLAEAQQRLIHSEDEIRRLHVAYREQSESIRAERARLLEAHARTDSEADAYLAATEAELIAKSTQVEELQGRIANLERQLDAKPDDATVASLRRQLSVLQSRHESEVQELADREARLREASGAAQQQLAQMYKESQTELEEKDKALAAQLRRIDTLRAESDRLRETVDELREQNAGERRGSEAAIQAVYAELQSERQRAMELQATLDRLITDNEATEAKLVKDRLALQQLMTSEAEESRREIEMLRLEIAADESTIKSQELRIRNLEDRINELNLQLADLRERSGESDALTPDMENAMAVLAMARSPSESNLGNFYALIIANQNYLHQPPLSTPMRDALQIRNILENRYDFEVEVVTDATHEQILIKLHDYVNRLDEEDNLLIYYAGRGSTPEGPPTLAYWHGIDADPVIGTGRLGAEQISDKIAQIQAKRVLVVTDSCFSKRRISPNTMTVGRGLDPKSFEAKTRLPVRFVLTSGANVPILDENGDRTHSLFASAFLDVLQTNVNVLSGEMLSYEMSQRVQQRVADPERVLPTYHSLQGVGHMGGDFFFVPIEDPEPTLYAAR